MNRFAIPPTPFTTLALAVALGLAGMLSPVEEAVAGAPVGSWTRASHVTDSVTDNLNGTWDYGYTVFNDSNDGLGRQSPNAPFIVDWELPWFGDAGITNILSPLRWNYSIETIGTPNGATGWGGDAAWQDSLDDWYAGPTSPFTTATQVLHWYSECWVQPQPNGFVSAAVTLCEVPLQDAIAPGSSLGGFGFTAAFGPTGAPYQASWAEQPVLTGDPAFPLGGGIPNSPSLTPLSSVPEPSLLALLGAGALGWGFARRRQRSAKNV